MLIWMTSALYVYEFFEMFHAVCLFPTVPQFETLEYIGDRNVYQVSNSTFSFLKCRKDDMTSFMISFILEFG